MRALCLLGPALFVVVAERDTSADGNSRIIGGRPAERGQFPHQAHILMDGGAAACGGSLISSTKVLTAAHCTKWYRSFTVMLGGVDLDAPWTFWTVVTRTAVGHPDFYLEGPGAHNDIAIVFLPQTAPLGSYIKLVDLPSTDDVDNFFVGADASISGWGLISTSPMSKTPKLQWAELTVIPSATCQNYYDSIEILDSTLCAMSLTSTVCLGDSGGALVISSEGRYVQIGVVSFGKTRYCEVDEPTVYARVTSYIDWISSQEAGNVY